MNSGTQILILFVIIGINGFLAMSEMALVSARKTRLQKLHDDGHRGAGIALALADSPTQFLASLQICITILGIAAGAWGVANLSAKVQIGLSQSLPSIGSWAQPIGVGFVVAVETFLMVLLGELIPKRLALFSPERIAVGVAPIIAGLGQIISPASIVLGRITDNFIRFLPFRPHSQDSNAVTEDEIKIMVEQGAEAGVFDKNEESMLMRALDFSELSGSDLMTPRTRIISYSADSNAEDVVDLMLKAGFSNYPVYQGDQDNFVGIVSIKQLYAQLRKGRKSKLLDLMRPPVFLPDSAKAGKIIETMKKNRRHLVILIDEFGGVAGLLTATDLMEAVVGEVPGDQKHDAPKFVQRTDGSWLVDGMAGLFEVEQQLGYEPDSTVSDDCQTIGGLVMHYLDSIPKEGQIVEMPGWSFEVVDMDRNRIDKVLVTKKNMSCETTPESPLKNSEFKKQVDEKEECIPYT
ncbi:MAG: hemolysin family protein [Proteobacteria bacterium]|nr:hemolysin family protein [Pseudomonadota bacterium]